MKPIATSPRIRNAIEARVLTWGTARAWPEQLAQWRKQPTPNPVAIGPTQLKQSEDQTVAAVWAVSEALASLEDRGSGFGSWGVIAAPCFMGRAANAFCQERFRQEGAFGISPQTIPHHSFHAVSGTLSQLLKIHGPNFGVGNSPTAAVEAWLVAATLLSENIVPGLWLVFTEHLGEYLPASRDETAPRVECEAIALALVPGRGEGDSGLRLRICPEDTAVSDPLHDPFLTGMSEFTLGQFGDELARRDSPPAGMWRLPGAGWVEIEMR